MADLALRDARYQGAIIQDQKILLIKHHEFASGFEYWLVPGGGMEPGESEEECLTREMREETNLEVKVVRLLYEEPVDMNPGEGYKKVYQRQKTFLCEIISGTPTPGYEPEHQVNGTYEIDDIRWFDLVDENQWGTLIMNDPITLKLLRTVRTKMGYR